MLISVNSTLKAKMSHCFYEVPEILIFCMLGVFEACIRSRLMPRNENYAAFFSAMKIPAMITNAALSPVYRTAEALDAGPEQLRAAPAEARRRWRRAAAGSACCTGTRSR